MKIIKPKLEDYLKASKGQNPAPFNGQTVSIVTNVDTTRVVTSQVMYEWGTKQKDS